MSLDKSKLIRDLNEAITPSLVTGGNVPKSMRELFDRKYYNLVSNIGKALEWNMELAGLFCVLLLEDVNAHKASAAVDKLLAKAWGDGKEKSLRPWGDAAKLGSMVNNVAKQLEYGIFEAGAFCVLLLEDVNAHDESKKVDKLLLKIFKAEGLFEGVEYLGDDESPDEDLTEDLKLGKKDKAVIDAFIDKKSMEGHKLRSDGKSLVGIWAGGEGSAGSKGLAWWEGGKIHLSTPYSKATQTVIKAVRKTAPESNMAKESMDEAVDTPDQVKLIVVKTFKKVSSPHYGDYYIHIPKMSPKLKQDKTVAALLKKFFPDNTAAIDTAQAIFKNATVESLYEGDSRDMIKLREIGKKAKKLNDQLFKNSNPNLDQARKQIIKMAKAALKLDNVLFGDDKAQMQDLAVGKFPQSAMNPVIAAAIRLAKLAEDAEVDGMGANTLAAKLNQIVEGAIVIGPKSQVGATILDQLGGYGRMSAMLGINRLKYMKNGLAFGWPNKQRSKGNYVEITLRPDDTYDMEFYNLSTKGMKSVKKMKGVYWDQLIKLFEKQTGWFLRLSDIGQESDSLSETKKLKVGDRVVYGPDPRTQGFRLNPDNVGTVKKIEKIAGLTYAVVGYGKRTGKKDSSYPVSEFTKIEESLNKKRPPLEPKSAEFCEVSMDHGTLSEQIGRLLETQKPRKGPAGKLGEILDGLKDAREKSQTESLNEYTGDLRRFVANLAADAAKEAFKLMSRNLYTEFYVWYLPQGEQLKVATDKPGSQWKLAINERIPVNKTVRQITQWIIDRIGRLPILKPEHVESLDERQKTAPSSGFSGEKKSRPGAFKLSASWLDMLKQMPDIGDKYEKVLFKNQLDHINGLDREGLAKLFGADNIPDAQDVIAMHPKKAFNLWMKNLPKVSTKLAGGIRKLPEMAPLWFYATIVRIVDRMMANHIIKRYFSSEPEMAWMGKVTKKAKGTSEDVDSLDEIFRGRGPQAAKQRGVVGFKMAYIEYMRGNSNTMPDPDVYGLTAKQALQAKKEAKGYMARQSMRTDPMTVAGIMRGRENPSKRSEDVDSLDEIFRGRGPLVLMDYPNGRWGFVGSVPAELAWERKDGKPLTKEQIKELVYSPVPALIAKSMGVRDRSFKTPEEARRAAKKIGAKITQDVSKGESAELEAVLADLAELAEAMAKHAYIHFRDLTSLYDGLSVIERQGKKIQIGFQGSSGGGIIDGWMEKRTKNIYFGDDGVAKECAELLQKKNVPFTLRNKAGKVVISTIPMQPPLRGEAVDEAKVRKLNNSSASLAGMLNQIVEDVDVGLSEAHEVILNKIPANSELYPNDKISMWDGKLAVVYQPFMSEYHANDFDPASMTRRYHLFYVDNGKGRPLDAAQWKDLIGQRVNSLGKGNFTVSTRNMTRPMAGKLIEPGMLFNVKAKVADLGVGEVRELRGYLVNKMNFFDGTDMGRYYHGGRPLSKKDAKILMSGKIKNVEQMYDVFGESGLDSANGIYEYVSHETKDDAAVEKNMKKLLAHAGFFALNKKETKFQYILPKKGKFEHLEFDADAVVEDAIPVAGSFAAKLNNIVEDIVLTEEGDKLTKDQTDEVRRHRLSEASRWLSVNPADFPNLDDDELDALDEVLTNAYHNQDPSRVDAKRAVRIEIDAAVKRRIADLKGAFRAIEKVAIKELQATWKRESREDLELEASRWLSVNPADFPSLDDEELDALDEVLTNAVSNQDPSRVDAKRAVRIEIDAAVKRRIADLKGAFRAIEKVAIKELEKTWKRESRESLEFEQADNYWAVLTGFKSSDGYHAWVKFHGDDKKAVEAEYRKARPRGDCEFTDMVSVAKSDKLPYKKKEMVGKLSDIFKVFGGKLILGTGPNLRCNY